MLKKPTKIITSFLLPAFMLVALFALFNPTQIALAADVTVNTLVDERDFSCADGDCSLRDAIITAAPGDRIVVPAGTYLLTEGISIATIIINKDLTIEGASAATTIIDNTGCPDTECGTVFGIESGATVTFTNITVSGGRANGFPYSFSGHGIYVQNGDLNLSGTILTDNGWEFGNGGGLAVFSGTLTMEAGSIISGNVTGVHGAGVALLSTNAAFVMNGGTIANNSPLCGSGCAAGGGVYAAAGSFTINGGTITGNNSDNGAGVFFGTGGGAINGGEIRQNRTTVLQGSGVGGGISISGGTVTMTGGSIVSNTARLDNQFPGGGVRVENGVFNMSNGLISGNEAHRGGAVMVQSGTFNFSGGTLSNNIATYGGAAYLNNANAIMNQTGGIVASNVASATVDYGGGAFYVTLGRYVGTAGEIRENSSLNNGGVVAIADGTASFDGMTIISNTAATRGGVAHLRNSPGALTMTNNIISGNVPDAVSSTNGGANVTFLGNDVSNHALGLEAEFGNFLVYANNFENNTVAFATTGNGSFNGQHNWFGAGATLGSVGNSDAFDFRLGSPREAWSNNGTVTDSGNGRSASIVATAGSGTGLIISHGRDAADEPFGTNSFSLRCSDYYDFYVVGGSVGSTWDVTIPVDSSAACESDVAGGTPSTNSLFKFVTTGSGAPNTVCSPDPSCWVLWSASGTVSRNGSAGSYSITGDDIPLTELQGTPFAAAYQSAPTAISLSAFATTTGAAPTLGLIVLMLFLVVLTTMALRWQRRSHFG